MEPIVIGKVRDWRGSVLEVVWVEHELALFERTESGSLHPTGICGVHTVEDALAEAIGCYGVELDERIDLDELN